MAAAEAVFAEKTGSSESARLGPVQGRSSPPGPAGDVLAHKRQRRSYNAAQNAALSLEAQKAARGETRASNRDIAAQISELDGGRIVTGQDVGNWFRNQQGKKKQRAGAGGNGAVQAP